ncbi:60S ribosomal protein L30 [Colletotrichum orbiculare MAFF 240422]|uniref:60S ribosomal protein L30 n=1 Tax=Colletotrichum orbiculare (strain 104-T / ATCC 96160 / CBS 514.97 / LARS 414 / MAFF 240422) TaxID=1213857 RepID=A0A484FPV9_COLOR|nr:60S ribosomal protein L30 [Colletotrichum orbiculare MAFF 240422]
MGYSTSRKALRSGKAKLVLISAKTPPLRRSELENFAMLSKAPVHHFNGTNNPGSCEACFRHVEDKNGPPTPDQSGTMHLSRLGGCSNYCWPKTDVLLAVKPKGLSLRFCYKNCCINTCLK